MPEQTDTELLQEVFREISNIAVWNVADADTLKLVRVSFLRRIHELAQKIGAAHPDWWSEAGRSRDWEQEICHKARKG